MTQGFGSSPIDFDALRARLHVPDAFPPEVLAEADAVAGRPPTEAPDGTPRVDASSIPFITIDPATSLDLDQAFYAEAEGDGFLVRYAIADVAHFVDRGGTIEAESWRRGVTLYGPDGQTPLYPTSLSHGAASLLPDVDRPAIVFTLRLDADGRDELLAVERSVVRSRAKLSYDDVSEHLKAEREQQGTGRLAGNEWSEALALLERIGRKRQTLEIERGGVSLPVAEQHVSQWAAALTGYRLTLRSPNDVEGWNAQISLMTGIASARLLASRGLGLFRVVSAPREDRVRALRLTTAALGVSWPETGSYADFIRSLDPTSPRDTAIMIHAAGVMGGARYEAFTGEPGPKLRHAAIGAFYAHVTAPMRRLADRYVLDLLVAEQADDAVSPDTGALLGNVAEAMNDADRRAREFESAIVDAAEAALLAGNIGESFDALVVRVRERAVTVQLTDPPARADVALADVAIGAHPHVSDDGAAIETDAERVALGQTVRLTILEADPTVGRVRFARAP